MNAVSSLFTGWSITDPTALVVLLASLVLLIALAARARAGHGAKLRRIPAFDAIKQAVGQAAELGRPLHVALGVGGIGKQATLETLAGVEVLEYLAYQAALCDAPLSVSVADPTVLPTAQETLYRGYEQAGYPDEYDSRRVQLLAPDNVAYAAGVMTTLHQQNLAANVMVGTFGDEFLLMGETGARRGIPQIGGTTNPQTLPFVYASTDHALLGEEIFAAGAYLRQDRNHVGGLMAADVARLGILGAAIVVIILRTLGIL